MISYLQLNEFSTCLSCIIGKLYQLASKLQGQLLLNMRLKHAYFEFFPPQVQILVGSNEISKSVYTDQMKLIFSQYKLIVQAFKHQDLENVLSKGSSCTILKIRAFFFIFLILEEKKNWVFLKKSLGSSMVLVQRFFFFFNDSKAQCPQSKHFLI